MPFTGGPDRDVGQRGGDVVRRDGLHRAGDRRTVSPVGARLDDAADELEELGRAEDRVGNAGGLDQVLLGQLGAEVAALRQAVGADDRQRDVMPHAGGRFRGEQVAAGGLEELQDRLVLERRRVRHVDDDLGAGERLGQPLAGDGVDARVGRCRQDLMALLAKPARRASIR